jgi:hypothetical protein
MKKSYYIKHRQQILQQQHSYREVNKESRNTYHREMRKKDPKRYYSYTNKWRLNNLDYFNTLVIEWKKKNPDKWKKILQRGHANHHQQLGWNLLYDNPFDEPVDYHHIDNLYVVAVPKDLHNLYKAGKNTEIHRINLSYIVEQLYGNCNI